MTQEQLTLLNVGQNLDDLMNLDPRGYGVCRILYPAAREYTGEPIAMGAAKQLVNTIKENDLVYIITGFVLLPFKKAEMDGIISSILLARSLVKAFNAKPVIICPKDNYKAVKNLSNTVGLHLFEGITEEFMQCPISMAVVEFTKDKELAVSQSEELVKNYLPKAVVSIEAPGANEKGVYHNATGLDVTELEAKSDILFERLQKEGVLNIAIGDLGNEIGMGTISEHLNKYIPYAAPNGCRCGCNGGIAVKTKADHIITATVSDWGAYALMASIAFLLKDIEIFHTADMEKKLLDVAAKSGMIDMYGWLVPAIDGVSETMIVNIVSLMSECIKHAMKLEKTCETWFEKVIELGFYN